MTTPLKKKVLIADDDNELRTVLTDKLTRAGFEVIGAADGEEGLAKALELHPDVILLDGMMPKVSGWDMLDILRRDPWGKHAKIVMLTVLEDASHVAYAMEKGSFRYLVKIKHSLDDIVRNVQEELDGKPMMLQ